MTKNILPRDIVKKESFVNAIKLTTIEWID